MEPIMYDMETIMYDMETIMPESIEIEPQPNATPPSYQRDKGAAIIKGVVRATDIWKLSDDEAAMLFGVTIANWNKMKDGTFKDRLYQDNITRASLLFGLFKGLRLLFNGPLTDHWPKTKNAGPGFNGKTPVEIMCEGGIPAMIRMRQHIDALRSGV